MILNRKKLVGISIASLLLILSILFMARFNSLNNKFPPPTIEAYQINEPVRYGSFEITMLEHKMMDKTELQNFSAVYGKLFTNEIKDIKSIVTTINIKNTSNKKMILEVYPFILESKGFSNGVNLDLFMALNTNKTMTPELNAGEEIKLQLPFTLIEKQFTKQDWANVTRREFELVLSLYPEKKSIFLNKIKKSL
ncbi:hypothetical protein [Bacillus tuaregi]|uniref:hypothetical protein n=1 Tax=Bacillus tuaregi TaxID=1816695 RepID=UPI0008F85E09|nr:hypothetical protein [Bacillus tuaregi]